MKKYVRSICGVVLAAALLTGCSSASSSAATSSSKSVTAAAPVSSAVAASSVAASQPEAAAEIEKTKVYVTPQWVQSVMDGQQPQSEKYVIIEGSWGETSEDYQKAHIPGAVHMNTDLIESPEYWNIRSPEEITKVMQDFGITKDTAAIVYGNGSAAARIAFVLLWAGVDEVHLLDGGFAAWENAGLATETEERTPTPVDDFGAVVPAHPEYLLSMPEEVIEAQKDPNFRLVSIRSWEEFTGEESGYSYIERAGEPEGAVWGHDEADYYNEDGTIKPLAEIEEMWAEWDISKENTLSFYCGTGWRATVPFFICYENGWDNISLYDGGWFAWQMDESLPVQTGDPREAQ